MIVTMVLSALLFYSPHTKTYRREGVDSQPTVAVIVTGMR